MDESMLPVKRDVRRAFERAARTYDEAAVLQREVCARLVEHLEPMRLSPRRAARPRLRHGARVRRAGQALSRPRPCSGSTSRRRCSIARARRSPWWQRLLGAPRPSLVCADAERLPRRERLRGPRVLEPRAAVVRALARVRRGRARAGPRRAVPLLDRRSRHAQGASRGLRRGRRRPAREPLRRHARPRRRAGRRRLRRPGHGDGDASRWNTTPRSRSRAT